jgi:hypothetical protein
LLFCHHREQPSQEQEVIPPSTSAPDTSIDVSAVFEVSKELPSISGGPNAQKMIEVLRYDSDIAKIRGVVDQIRPQFGVLDQMIEVIIYFQSSSRSLSILPANISDKHDSCRG